MEMTELGPVLELMHRAPESFSTLRGVVEKWTHLERRHEASRRLIAHREQESSLWTGYTTSSFGFGIMLIGGRQEEPPETTEARTQLWLQPPDRVREETSAGSREMVRVRNGARAWDYDERLGLVEREADEAAFGSAYAWMLNPLALVPSLELQIVGEQEIAGRPAIRLRAEPRDSEDPIGPAGVNGDEIDLSIDCERGILLALEARLDGEPFERTTFAEIKFDEPLDAELFRLVPPPGAPIRSDAEIWPGAEANLTLEEAAKKASFTVFAPTAMWPDARLHVVYVPGRDERFPTPEQVSLTYHEMSWTTGRARHLSLWEVGLDRADGAGTGFAERVDLDDAVVFIRAVEGEELTSSARVIREHTQIDMYGGGLDREDLLEIARSLVPARHEPPKFR
jgi:outer membrane lipoprotein-sorting protein